MINLFCHPVLHQKLSAELRAATTKAPTESSIMERAFQLYGITLQEDADLPVNVAEYRGQKGKVIQRITLTE